MSDDKMKLVFVGAGVIGGSVGGWIAKHHPETVFVDVGETAAAIRKNGITTYPGGDKDAREHVDVNVIDDVSEVPDADVVVIGVKNYHLDAVAKSVRDKLGDAPIVVGMQNGIANQRILPNYFSKVIYCVVSYNAWMDKPGVIGYQKKGPLHIGTLDGGLKDEMRRVAAVFGKGVETEITDTIQDAIHSKIVINLTNSITTLLGLGIKEIEDRALFQKLLSGLLWEGVNVMKAAGFKESKLGGMPSWLLLGLSARLPRFLTAALFEKNVKKMVISSMAQDVLQRGSTQTELDSINGYVIELADKHGLDVPINRAVYKLCRIEFGEGGSGILEPDVVWNAVKAGLR